MSDCYIPEGEVTRLGYVRLWNKGKRILAHRAAYEAMHGKVPEGYELDHICRNRSCANVSHLRVVSHTENMRNSSQTKLTLEKAKEIVALRRQGEDMYKIAKLFNVTPQCIWLIIHGKTWKEATLA